MKGAVVSHRIRIAKKFIRDSASVQFFRTFVEASGWSKLFSVVLSGSGEEPNRYQSKEYPLGVDAINIG